jgi:hypothetical protein
LKWLAVVLLGSIPTGILLVQADGMTRAQVNLDNPLFQPVLGVSLPVILVDGFALLGLAAWRRWNGRARF